MTIVAPEPRPPRIPTRAPHDPTPSRADRKSPRPAPLAAVAALLVLAAWLISSFWISVEIRSPRHPFPAPTAHQTWVRAPTPGARAYFRLRFPISNPLPDTAILWIEGFQKISAYVDGTPVAPSLTAPNANVDTAPDIPKVVQTIDIRPFVDRGMNVIGLEVVSLNGQAPAFRARLELRTGSFVSTYGVSPGSWRSTTDAGLTGQVLPQSGTFSRPNLDDGNWAPGVASAPKPGIATVTVPVDAYTQPTDAPALIGTFGAQNLVASTTVTFPSDCDEGWLRVAASGSYAVSLDGRQIASGVPTLSSTTTPLTIFDLCPVATPGRHTLTVSVAGSARPTVYVDGLVRSGDGQTTSIATGPGWYTGSAGGPQGGGTVVGRIAAPEVELRQLFVRVPGTTVVPAGPLLAHQILLSALLLVLAMVAMAAGWMAGLSVRGAASAVLYGCLPAVGLVLLLTETRHLVYVQAPFPSTPFMLLFVLALAALGVTVAVTATAWRRQRPPSPVRQATRLLNDRRRGWARAHWYQLAIGFFAGGWALIQSYRIMFNPLWQDELSSLAAAQGMRAHLVPEWPSGFLYWKSELFTALIAVVGGVTHDNPSVLREISVLWFGATVAIFGLCLMPLVLKGRRVYQLIATIVFATSPFEMGHAQDIRMYQMLQFVVVLVAILFIRALRHPTTRRVAAVMAAVVAMYLTHEESFGVLLVIPLGLFAYSGLRWIRNWRWWVFGGAALAVIGVQLMLAAFTHPPTFGVDPSGGPLVEWSPKPFFYLSNFFFTSTGYGASITVVSALALVAVIVGLFRREGVRLYLAAFWVVPTIVVSLILLTKDTRYVFLCLPFVFALGACAVADIVDLVARLAQRAAPLAARGIAQAFVAVFAGFLTIAIMLSLIGGLNDYGTFTGALFHANVSQRRLDYPTAVAYVKAHMQPGDIVITASSANLVGYNLGRPPNYWIPPHRTETLLYVFEKHDEAVDTQYGIPTILNAVDFLNAINGASRVWLVGEDSVIRSLIVSMRSIVQTRFTLKEDGAFVSVFLATNT